MKKFTKKNNKGFSLVELIVVVLIMAIIAVALSPQVMKWVGNARIAADNTSYNALVSNAQLAYANENVFTTCKGETYTVTMDGTNTKVTGGTDSKRVKFTDEMDNLVDDWTNIKAKVSGATYTFTITDGKVTKVVEPNTDDVK